MPNIEIPWSAVDERIRRETASMDATVRDLKEALNRNSPLPDLAPKFQALERDLADLRTRLDAQGAADDRELQRIGLELRQLYAHVDTINRRTAGLPEVSRRVEDAIAVSRKASDAVLQLRDELLKSPDESEVPTDSAGIAPSAPTAPAGEDVIVGVCAGCGMGFSVQDFDEGVRIFCPLCDSSEPIRWISEPRAIKCSTCHTTYLLAPGETEPTSCPSCHTSKFVDITAGAGVPHKADARSEAPKEQIEGACRNVSCRMGFDASDRAKDYEQCPVCGFEIAWMPLASTP